MITLLSACSGSCGSSSAARQLALENLALRQQLAVYKRTIVRPPLRPTDRFFWLGLAKIWTGWQQALVIVTPATVLHWQRRRFREYWSKLAMSENSAYGYSARS